MKISNHILLYHADQNLLRLLLMLRLLRLLRVLLLSTSAGGLVALVQGVVGGNEWIWRKCAATKLEANEI